MTTLLTRGMPIAALMLLAGVSLTIGCGDPLAAPQPPRVDTPTPPQDDGDDPPDPVEPPEPPAPTDEITPEILLDGTQRFDLPRYVIGSPDAPEGAELNANGFYEVTVSPDYSWFEPDAAIEEFQLCTVYAIEAWRPTITIGDCVPHALSNLELNEDGTLTFPYGQYEDGDGFFYSEARVRWLAPLPF